MPVSFGTIALCDPVCRFTRGQVARRIGAVRVSGVVWRMLEASSTEMKYNRLGVHRAE